MIKIIIFFIFLNQIFLSENDNKHQIPKLDLRDGGIIPNLSGIGGVLDKPIEASKILIQAEIDEIKNRAKNFETLPYNEQEIVFIETNLGTLKIKLFYDVAPNHCNNLKKLSNSGYYDETLFFRVVNDFIIQGGDLLTRDGVPSNDGTGNPGWTINAEFSNLKHKRGTVSMHRGSDINSAGSQFFICLTDAPHLDNKYTIIGEIIEDENLLNIINNIPSETKQILSMSKKNIPDNSNKDNWLEYKFNENKYFFKIPPSQTEDSYKQYISEKINNIYRPNIPVIIKKMRIIHKDSLVINESNFNIKSMYKLNNSKSKNE